MGKTHEWRTFPECKVKFNWCHHIRLLLHDLLKDSNDVIIKVGTYETNIRSKCVVVNLTIKNIPFGIPSLLISSTH
jgi:hypothetical protein